MNTFRDILPINDYANSMFRFDFLNWQWINNCTYYLRELFGMRLDGAIVLDYAFGRGNWTVALRNAGASKVIAIDASEDNCRRLHNWLAKEKITGIEIIHGNVLDAPIACLANIVWAHGILHHVENPLTLLHALRKMAPYPDALFHIYAYDRGSLRQIIVDTIRRVLIYSDENAFRADSPLFSQQARLRVRDDLTAPVIHWISMAELGLMASELNLAVEKQHVDYIEWLHGKGDEEFQPHNLLLRSRNTIDIPLPLIEPLRPHSGDVELLTALISPLFDTRIMNIEQARGNAIGLSNTHFDALAKGGITEALQQDFLQIFYLLKLFNLVEAVNYPPAKELLRLADAALSDLDRTQFEISSNSRFLVPYLRSNSIRL
jgi:hypothetical protein